MMRPLFGKIETLGPWTAHIQAMDQAVTENDPGEAVRAWRQAYSAALSHPGWLGLLTVAAASLRLDAFPGLARGATARARSCLGVRLGVEDGRTHYRRGPRPGGCESGSSFFGSDLGGATETQPRFFMHSSSSVPLMVHAARSRRNSAVVYF